VPSESLTVRWPQAVQTRDGVIHVVWASPDTAAGADPDKLRTLWTADWVRGRWMRQRLLFSGEQLNLAGPGTAALLVHGMDIHVLVQYDESGPGGGSGIVYARRLGGRWLTTAIRIPAVSRYVTAQLIGGDSLVVAVAAVDTRIQSHNGTHLFVSRVSVRDEKWSDSRRVQWSGDGNVDWPTMFATKPLGSARPQLVVVWAASLLGRITSIVSVSSPNGGLTWSPPAVLPLQQETSGLRMVQDGAGTIHVVGVPRRLRGGTEEHPLWMTSWRAGTWSPPVALPFTAPATLPALAAVGSDSLMMWWGEVPSAEAASPRAPVTKYAFARIACARRTAGGR
jgi:hypothetical protein